ncbi:MAG: nitrous oxide reductase family maturation protein NosD, partial [Methyloligellaceae bacterium]
MTARAALRGAMILAASLLVGGVIAPAAARAATIHVEAGPGRLAQAAATAASGDTLRLAKGRHQGPLIIDKPLRIIGDGDAAVIEGGGSGHVVTVRAPGVVVRGVTVTGSGLSLATQDSGIF